MYGRLVNLASQIILLGSFSVGLSQILAWQKVGVEIAFEMLKWWGPVFQPGNLEFSSVSVSRQICSSPARNSLSD